MSMTQERNTVSRGPIIRKTYPVKASTKIYNGGMVALNGGYAIEAGTAGKQVVGKACFTADNTSGGDGAITIDVEEGEFKYTNGSSFAASDVGTAPVYASDGATVSSATTGSTVNLLASVDSDGVWVKLSEQPL